MKINLQDYFGGLYEIYCRKHDVISIWVADKPQDPADKGIIGKAQKYLVFVHLRGSLYATLPNIQFEVLDKDKARKSIDDILGTKGDK